MGTERLDFKGKAILSIQSSKIPYPFTFGVNKARAILDNIDEIRKFVQDNTKTNSEKQTL